MFAVHGTSANARIEFFAKLLKVPRSSVTIASASLVAEK
jgi:uncharacterized protein YggU (UPF0235/DUF167 family)